MTVTTPKTFPWRLARRTIRMGPSAIREILKITERPGIISFAGGLPSPKTFPVAEFEAACAKVLHHDGHAALQYAASEGFGPLRDVVAARLPWQVDPTQILITTGSHKSQRDAMLEALAREMPAGDSDSTLTWNTPSGGMFVWARLPKGMNAVDFLPHAVAQGVAFVPGAPFYAEHADPRTLRLSFVTPSVDEIYRGVAALAAAYKNYAAAE